MKYHVISLTILIIFSFCKVNAQTAPNKRKQVEIIKFLLVKKELTDESDTVLSNLDVMYTRNIASKNKGNPSAVYIFGAMSPHGKRFIALDDNTGINLLETKNLPTEIQLIVAFFKRNLYSQQQILNCLNEIGKTYEYDEKMNFKTVEEKR
ncbi:hypothetical protein HDF19_10875 [Mucilaginibacter sp. E4BP6]|uniref:hypothetical protein n=1 Tax=Mucilaginibacter sp. E4BP6 TaxID=2723089 RepID=UPI0015CA6425|nr:hypothetical protein [Mucilaginibacter sp. E4BP6]NYE65342.1 hypothetical protein [Mucilaginibacter sp. E4BP6]